MIVPMNVGVLLATRVAVVCLLATSSAAQRQGQPGPVERPAPGGQAAPAQGRGTGAEFAGPPQGQGALPIVEVVGCLTLGANNAWSVTSATEPVRAPAGWSKADEVKAAEIKPLGTGQLGLIGLVELSPAEHKGHKVVVKGMLIKDANSNRLNVTSLMTVSLACQK